MQATLNWDQKMGFAASGDSGHEIKVDVGVDVGGQNSGPRPMELVLFGLGGCTGADVASILNKMRIDIKNMTIEIKAERTSDHPKRFTSIHLIFRMTGAGIDRDKALHAIELSQNKYCSVAASLNATLTYELIIE